MRLIYKYPVEEGGSTYCLPEGAQVLHVGEQRGALMLWIMFDPNGTQSTERTFRYYHTGAPITDRLISYVGTVQTFLGASHYVRHVFEVLP